MNDIVQRHIKTLAARSDVRAVILFGSRARGNNRPDSDVDLVVILTEGYRRAIEEHDGLLFEIVYVTEDAALKFWLNNPDDGYGVWEVAKILVDKDGCAERLRNQTSAALAKGKPAIDDFQRSQLRFDAEDQISYAERIAHDDLATAELVLSNKVFSLAETFFNLRRMWIPGPKQRLALIRKSDPSIAKLFEAFYGASALVDRIADARALGRALFPQER